MIYLYLLAFAAALLIVLVITPGVKAFAIRIGAVDKPNHRKVHTRTMPRLGGLAIFIAFAVVGWTASLLPWIDLTSYETRIMHSMLVGGLIIVVLGVLDDKFEIKPKWKLLGQLLAACVVVFGFHIKMNLVNIPFGESTMSIPEWLSIPLTILWIVGVTNAINLIDGLDGLAAGVSGIATATILAMAMLVNPNEAVILLSAILLGSVVGFLFFNFHPAKLFMGDTGSMFLGFSLATLSMLGFKQTTLVSFVIPLLIIGVPLSDTFFAIVRRMVNKQPISVADKSHLHHCLRELGFSHRKTVLIIYAIASFFGICAVLLSQAAVWVTIVVICVILLVLQVGAEVIGIVDKSRRPILNLFLRPRMKSDPDSQSK